MRVPTQQELALTGFRDPVPVMRAAWDLQAMTCMTAGVLYSDDEALDLILSRLAADQHERALLRAARAVRYNPSFVQDPEAANV